MRSITCDKCGAVHKASKPPRGWASEMLDANAAGPQHSDLCPVCFEAWKAALEALDLEYATKRDAVTKAFFAGRRDACPKRED